MNSSNEEPMSESQSNPSKTKMIAGVIGVMALAAAIIGIGLSQGGPDDGTQPAAGGDIDTPGELPDVVPFVDDFDACSLTLHEAITSQDDISDALSVWSDHLRRIASTAPANVAVALDDLASDYDALADAESDTFSATAEQVIGSAGGATANTELVDTYLESSCS